LRHALSVTDPDGDIRRITLPAGVFRIGRLPGNELELPLPDVSRRHAMLTIRQSAEFAAAMPHSAPSASVSASLGVSEIEALAEAWPRRAKAPAPPAASARVAMPAQVSLCSHRFG
jgi:hypothetical protein